MNGNFVITKLNVEISGSLNYTLKYLIQGRDAV
jgi:hypothetical protein